MMSLIFDVETSGLFPRGANYKNIADFDNARLVSICWILTQGDTMVEQAYFVIKPDFIIPQESIAIHGITNEYAQENGVHVLEVLNNFMASVAKCQSVVAHNIAFDETIVKSELLRAGLKDHIETFKNTHKICTMIKGRQYMRVRKYPKLAELYKFLYNDEIQNAHNAVFDTKYCFHCYIKLFPADPNVFYFGDKAIQLTSQQSNMVFEEVQTNMLIVAGAGSGKTTSMISRIKQLVDSGISEASIMLTTFTRNAAQDIRDKLYDIMGYIPEIHVGTFDSIAKSYVVANDINSDDIKEVQEYAPRFLKLIIDQPKLIQKIKYLFVDEVQDINEVQYRIMHTFYKNGCFIVGIGDDSQNIYEFRGSNIEYILKFAKTFSPCKTHMLTKNFRSTEIIVDFANKVIEKNKNKIPKTMTAHKEGGDPIFIHGFKNSEVQYRHVLDKIKDTISNNQGESICVMCWINQPLVDFQRLLRDNSISHVYIRDIEEKTQDNVQVVLNTIHKSKGLEWDHVFLISMTDDNNKNIYKYAKKNNHNAASIERQIEANRRLFYVAITRAKKTLHILSSDYELTRFIVSPTT